MITSSKPFFSCTFEKTTYMKKIYLLLGFIASSVSLSAQGYVVSPNDTIVEEVISSTYKSSTINLEHDNLTTDSLKLIWEIVENTIPLGWDYSYCDYTNCYSSSITSGVMKKVGPTQMGFIKVTLSATTADNALLRFRVYNNGFPENADTLTFIYNSTLGTLENELIKNISVYPNPSNGEFTINNIPENSSVTILNSLGQAVVIENDISSKYTLSSNLNPGVYFLKISKNNKNYTTKKLIIK